MFSSEMVRAILDGRKTQTRRVIKPQPTGADYWTAHNPPSLAFYPNTHDAQPKILRCPYGQVGEWLWVRETLCRHYSGNNDIPDTATYSADRAPVAGIQAPASWCGKATWRWRIDILSSMFMPRWASRIALEITGVRVERLQDITPDDAFCEGVIPNITAAETDCLTPFRALWDSINARRGYGWAVNPWVWVIEFRRVSP